MSEEEQKNHIKISWIAEMHFWVLVVYIKQIIKRTDAQQLAYRKEQMIYRGSKTKKKKRSLKKRRNEMVRGKGSIHGNMISKLVNQLKPTEAKGSI
ncbi:uncharacterized protein ARB_02339 [Trichophyton benhamiae CBS 112371]|uniref:Uncharacterized protein n=1 Tax=Arthroderma benhamiae (strain ATCC MYA-4681 / CBS 112371) TaxID=663331 RepID=D4B1L0_ARTBC|nr:uncharacterized protein ARB_02339 [Trichophyton benhamiae CBS 112371]EFE30849.1 hypothetical protein ARB_02339 [Trichophyton benhamiae CBS 112371]